MHVDDHGAPPAHGKEEVGAYWNEQFSVFSNEKAAHVKRIIGEGEVVEMRSYPDIAGVMAQIGLMGG